jgi:hypothetical protein
MHLKNIIKNTRRIIIQNPNIARSNVLPVFGMKIKRSTQPDEAGMFSQSTFEMKIPVELTMNERDHLLKMKIPAIGVAAGEINRLELRSEVGKNPGNGVFY